jgi:hypothetical protein
MNKIGEQFRRAIKECSICQIAIPDNIYKFDNNKKYKWITSYYKSKNRSFAIPLQDKEDNANLFQVLEEIEPNQLSGFEGLTMIKINKEAFKECYMPIIEDGIFILKGSISSFPSGEPYPFYLAIKFLLVKPYMPPI